MIQESATFRKNDTGTNPPIFRSGKINSKQQVKNNLWFKKSAAFRKNDTGTNPPIYGSGKLNSK